MRRPRRLSARSRSRNAPRSMEVAPSHRSPVPEKENDRMRTLTAPRPRFCAGVLALLAALAAPACSSDSGDADVAGGAGVGAPGDPSGGDGFGINGQDYGEPMPPPPTITPSGLLLLPQERLEAIETLVAAGDPRWLSFKNQTDEWLGDI